MAFEVTEHNIAALESLFKPWEEPIYHRLPNPISGQPALIQPGRRPSKVPLVRSIRAEIDGWRRGGYAGVSDTSRFLLTSWFDTEHQVSDSEGNSTLFRYHWAQREAIETIIYLYELRNVRNVAELLFEFGDDQLADIALGIPPEEDRWGKYCAKIATGGGKTKVISLAIVWSYFHSCYEPNSNLAQHFVIIAPNLTVYERLKDDFENNAIFYNDPLLPEEWQPDFQMQVVLQDEPGGAGTAGAIYLTNIHRLYEKRDDTELHSLAVGNGNSKAPQTIFGPEVKRAQALDTSAVLRERITSHPQLMVFNDEAHHLHDPDLAWSRAIDALHEQSLSKGNSGVCLQLDFTATPKHNNGDLFRHIICDFPLGEAVDAGIVKVPVLGESDELINRGDRNMPAYERFSMHLQLGYQRYSKTYDELNPVRKPILFVMTEEAKAADEIATYLDSDQFPLLKGRVLNVHTRLKGKIKTVNRGGLRIKEFVENEKSMKPDDLRALREMSRDLDGKDSKFRCVVSVMMLREGWDVRNVTTIVPLRPYSAKSGILPEQTLGRGLRRMFAPEQNLPETVTVVHHPAFRRLYEDELAQEGLDIAVLPIREAIKQTVTIFVDREKKAVNDFEIELPRISDAIITTAELDGLTLEEVKTYFTKRFQPLPIGKKREGPIEYKESHLFTDEVVSRMQLDAGLLNNAWSAASYFAKMLGRACRLNNPSTSLQALIEDFLSKVLFEREVNLYGGDVDHRMRDLDVMEHVRATFTPLILQKIVRKQERKRTGGLVKLSDWKPFQATSTEKRPAVQAQRTMFNLIPCDNEFEQEFADFCDYASDIVAFAKNAGPQKLMIDYLRPDGHRAFYIPDYFIRLKNGHNVLVELKGRVDPLVPIKAMAANEWCKTASKGKTAWQYLYVPYQLFQDSAAASIEELMRAFTPSLKELIGEAKTGQMALPLAEATAEAQAEELFTQVMKRAGISDIPKPVESIMRQSIQVLDDAIRRNMGDFAHAFQPLLRPLDDYALQILSKYLKPNISLHIHKTDYFNPSITSVPHQERKQIEKNSRYLKQNLVHGRSIQKLGTLLFCLYHAQQSSSNVPGIWRDVQKQFAGKEMAALYADLRQVNDFRNTHVAHIEKKLDDADEAWKVMTIWLRCVEKMVAIAS